MKTLAIAVVTLVLLTGCNNTEKQDAAVQRTKQATIDSINYANAQQRKIDSLQALTQSMSTATLVDGPAMIPLDQPGPKAQPAGKKVRKANPAPVATAPQSTDKTPTQTSSGNNSTPAPSNATVASTPEKKKGLNNSAKGAIIGLGTGAAAGAIIGKENRGKGAVIGGVVGAIGGAVGGAVIDRQKAKKAAQQDSLNKQK